MTSDLSTLLKAKADELGFSKIGITPAVVTPNEKTQLETWLKNGHHDQMSWIEKRKDEKGNIFEYYPAAKSVISVGMNYFTGYKQTDRNSDYKFSNYAWGDDYHHILKSKLLSLLHWLKTKQPEADGVVCVDTSPIMEKVWAQKAGLGWQGKHTNLISRDFGSWLFLGELILNIELQYDKPFTDDLCGSCTACIDACPTAALGEYEIYAEKCISYLTIEFRGDFDGHHHDLQQWIYGCDICQEVCPWNKKFSKISNEFHFQPKHEITHWTNEDWEIINEKVFSKLFKGSAVKRTKFSGLFRNINKNKEALCPE